MSLRFRQKVISFMNLHEYQSRSLLESYGVNVPRGQMIETPDEAFQTASDLLQNSKKVVVKAQAHTGGRGKGHFDTGFKSGVHFVDSYFLFFSQFSRAQECKKIAGEMLGHNLITKQTGAEGLTVAKILLVEASNIAHENYLAFLLDRGSGGVAIISSPQGGMSIEEVAEKDPDAVRTHKVPPSGLNDDIINSVNNHLNLSGNTAELVSQQIQHLYKCFMETDSTLLELNPFAIDTDNKPISVDAKISIDDNAEFKQKALFAERDITQEDPSEIEAAKHDLSYIRLDGTIGCLVNGAGLAMATCDILTIYGSQPANFLDVGGSATAEQVEAAFSILQADPKVNSILVNIFGGIMQCDIIAQGICTAAKNSGLKVPLIVRLSGTNAEEGMKILMDSGIQVKTAPDLDTAAQLAASVSASLLL